MAKRVAFFAMAGGALSCLAAACVLCLAAGCEKEKNKVPERVWIAAVAYCERLKECDGSWFASAYGSVEHCADIHTKYLPWDEYSQECIEAKVAAFECEASAPCIGGEEECHLQHQLKSYLCDHLDTATYGLMCGSLDNGSSYWDECSDACPLNDYIMAWCLCSADTADYCNCGGQQCADGEHCCYCEPNWL